MNPCKGFEVIPVLGGLLTVGLLATLGVGIVELPIITWLALAGLSVLVVAGAFFYLGYAFTRDVQDRRRRKCVKFTHLQ